MKNFGNKVFIVGIAGISMSAIAKILVSQGKIVFGSDLNYNKRVAKELKKLGIGVVNQGQRCDIEQFNPDSVIYSVAIKPTDAELVWARENNKNIFTRGEALGEITKDFKNLICISGSHGKTTTTALLTNIFNLSGLDFFAHIGGESQDIGGNLRLGNKKDYFITEACEYYDSFLSLKPTIAVILNIACDHLDYFKNVENLKNSFLKFAENVRAGGSVVVCVDDEGVLSIIKSISTNNKGVYTFSTTSKNADCYIVSYKKKKDGTMQVSVCVFGEVIQNISLPLVGEHNLKNLCACILVAKILGLKKTYIKNGIRLTLGVKRRYQRLGKINNITYIHDYAHHPDEINAVIDETRSNMKDFEKLIVVFESHTYTRTQNLWEGFAMALKKADSSIVLPIYPAREKPIKGITAKNLAGAITDSGGKGYFCDSYKKTEKLIKLLANKKSTVCLLLGAGNIDRFGDYLFKNAKS